MNTTVTFKSTDNDMLICCMRYGCTRRNFISFTIPNTVEVRNIVNGMDKISAFIELKKIYNKQNANKNKVRI